MVKKRYTREFKLKIVLDFPGYGYRRVTAELRRQSWQVNHKRVLRIMRAESLLCQLKRSGMTTTDSRHQLRTYPNLLAGLILTRPNQAWVADITYIRLPTCFVYLACVLDAFSRRCVGWKLSRTIDTQLTLAALNQAVAQRQPPIGLIHHSDRGVQYASIPVSATCGRLSLKAFTTLATSFLPHWAGKIGCIPPSSYSSKGASAIGIARTISRWL
jgi:transposase InsO family protein